MTSNLSFSGGVKIDGRKHYTEDVAIEQARIPEYVHIPLLQGSGLECEPIVEVGDKVKTGQKIGDLEGSFGACVHASISGEVTEIAERINESGQKVTCITIKSDGRDEKIDFQGRHDIKDLSGPDFVEIAKEAGIIGMGGAGFPFGVKLSSALDGNIDSILANGAECEPYLTSSDRVMIEYPKEVLEGMDLVRDIMGADHGFVVIEDNKPKAADTLNKASEDMDLLSVVVTETKYPQGFENILVDAVLDREVKLGELVGSQGAFVSNVETFKVFSDAVYEGKPSYERVIALTGPGLKEPKNLMVRVGTPIRELIDQCGGFEDDAEVVVLGGPMTGGQARNLDVPVSKRTTGLVILTNDEIDDRPESPCIKCGKCLDVCPIRLNPTQINAAVERRNYELAKDLNAEACKVCGACSYICPAKRDLTGSIEKAIRIIRTRLR